MKKLNIFVIMNIDNLRNKIENGIKAQDIMLNLLFGFLIFFIIFGIGFTLGLYAR